jgi:hypothetical protein
MNEIIEIKNVFDFPNEITRLAKSQQFYSLENHPADANTDITWDGEKSLNLNIILSPTLYENIVNQIISKLPFNVNIKQTLSMFHSFTDNDISSSRWFHTDSTSYGGVIYINNVYPKNPENHGTMILRGKDNIIIPYEYNKLVLYPSKYIHRPMNGFGDSLEASRLTLNFFIR